MTSRDSAFAGRSYPYLPKYLIVGLDRHRHRNRNKTEDKG
jgi:hypothetical protein